MPTNKEKYSHGTMSNDDLEARIAADLYELSDRFKNTDASMIGSLLWKLMGQIREAYRTARMITEGR
jgi:hypothetical protein